MRGTAGAGPAVRGLAPRELQRAVARHRTLLAAGLAAAAVAAGLTAAVPAQERAVLVLTATRDLAAGTALTPEDVVATPVPPGLVPEGALSELVGAVGRFVAGPVRRGEPLTDVRLLGAGLLGDGPAGGAATGATGAGGADARGKGDASEVAVPVRVAEPAVAALVQAGDRVDILSASPEGGPAAMVVAADVPVLSVPILEDDPTEGTLLVVAASRSTGTQLAAAAVTGRLSLVVLPR